MLVSVDMSNVEVSDGLSVLYGSSALENLLVVGLGNPGKRYSTTRHNVGYWSIEALLAAHSVVLRSVKREYAQVAEVMFERGTARGVTANQLDRFSRRKVIIATPTVFMNESGRTVKLLMRNRGIRSLCNLIVVHDELDLPAGRLHVKSGGGLAGHNGLRSIRDHLGGVAFTRVRIGIGRPEPGYTGDIAKYVLSKPSVDERLKVMQAVEKVPDIIASLACQEISKTMTRFNMRKSP